MSDCIVKIVPRNPFHQIEKPLLQKCIDFLKANIRCDSLESKCSNTPLFVDCGGNLKRIACPCCHAQLSFDWWGEVMDKAYKGGFTVLEAQMPCCKKTVSLNDLEYDFPCGFACWEIDIYNPDCDLDGQLIESVQRILDTNVRIIQAHI